MLSELQLPLREQLFGQPLQIIGRVPNNSNIDAKRKLEAPLMLCMLCVCFSLVVVAFFWLWGVNCCEVHFSFFSSRDYFFASSFHFSFGSSPTNQSKS